MNTEAMARGYLDDAEYSLYEAEEALAKKMYHRTVRRAQESVELSLKAVLRLLGVEYPREHDVSDALAEIARIRVLPDWFRFELETISIASKRLAGERGPAFYGDENAFIPPRELYSREDAEKAIDSARKIHELSKKLFQWWKGKS
ncbi:MAG: HEPN domain-containing protein [Thaumarchaeota archaeon]|nr:HEPN domain-containing protein [Nitrososphaerota archaeon]